MTIIDIMFSHMGRCKTWTLDSGPDYGLIFGLSSGPMWSSITTDNRCLEQWEPGTGCTLAHR